MSMLRRKTSRQPPHPELKQTPQRTTSPQPPPPEQTGSQTAPEGTTAATARDAHEGGATLRLSEPEFTLRPEQRLLTVVNKLDMRPGVTLPEGVIGISAKRGEGIDLLRHRLREQVDTAALEQGDTVVSNGCGAATRCSRPTC